MACTCFEWPTGEPKCFSPSLVLPNNTIEQCRVFCRKQKLGVLCHAQFGECRSDTCTGGDFMWYNVPIEVLRITASYNDLTFIYETEPGAVEDIFRYLACFNTEPTSPPVPIGTTKSWQAASIFDFRSFPGAPDFSLVSQFTVTIVGWEGWRTLKYSDGSPRRCSTTGLLRTPCCLPATETGPAHCEYITPAECRSRCGDPYEGTIYPSSPNPCTITGNDAPCGRWPCYPYRRDLTWQNSTNPDLWGGQIGSTPWCTLRTPTDCANTGAPPGQPTGAELYLNSRSCFEPREGSGVNQVEPTCVQGDWELTYRSTEHKPPLAFPTKARREGSTEIVSRKPERPVEPLGDSGSCAYHYGDVVYNRDLGETLPKHRKGSAAGSICTKFPIRREVDGHRCSRISDGYSWCPVVYGEDGNARFTCGYSVGVA